MKIERNAYLGIALLIFTYAVLNISIPIDQSVLSKYQISEMRAQLLSLSIIIPFAAIWLAAVYGFVQLAKYSLKVKKSVDGQAFWLIALGLAVLGYRLPLNSVLTTIFNYIGRSNPDFMPVSVIVLNYISVIAAVIGFTLISRGAYKLISISTKKPPAYIHIYLAVIVIGLTALYTYLAIGQPGYDQPLVPGQRATFYLPSWLIVSTIIFPYIYSWYTGLVAASNLYFYRKVVPGVLYKAGIRNLATGVAVVILSSAALQFLTTQSSRISKLNLAPLLGVVYALLIVISIGYVFIARGAKQLRKIEEV